MSPQIYIPRQLTPEQRMVREITKLRNKNNLTPDEHEKLDVLLHLLGVDD